MQNIVQVMLGCMPQYVRQIPNEFLVFTVIPLAMCLFGVHIFFRHFVTIMWFTVKLCVAVIIYLQIRELMTSTLQTSTNWSLEYSIFGVPHGTLNTAASLGFKIIKSKFIFTVREAFFQNNSPQESSPWVDWIDDTLFI